MCQGTCQTGRDHGTQTNLSAAPLRIRWPSRHPGRHPMQGTPGSCPQQSGPTAKTLLSSCPWFQNSASRSRPWLPPQPNCQYSTPVEAQCPKKGTRAGVQPRGVEHFLACTRPRVQSPALQKRKVSFGTSMQEKKMDSEN